MQTSEKKLCLIYANCQRDLIKAHLELSSEFTANYEFVSIPYHFKAVQTNFIIPNEIIIKTGLFIYQPIADTYGQQSTASIINRLPANCHKISFPYIYFKGYHPQFTKLDSNNLQQRFINDGSNLNDINIISLVKQGYTNEEILELIGDENFYTLEFLQQNLNHTLQELSERECVTDIKIVDFIRSHYQQNYLFYIPAHPANLIGLEVTNQILAKLNFNPLTQSHHEEQLATFRIPIYPSVIKHLNLQFGNKLIKYKPLSFMNDELDFNTCSQRYIETYHQLLAQKNQSINSLSLSIPAMKSVNNSPLRISIIGGSNSLMRNGYTKYLSENLSHAIERPVNLNYFALGGVTNLFGAIQNIRNNAPQKSDLILFEYCVNDRKAISQGKYSIKLAGRTLEGFIRRTKTINPNCRIIILIFGTNSSEYYDNCCQVSALYEAIAKRYDIPVINISEILLKTQGIKFIKSLYEPKDNAHYSRAKGVQIVSQIITQEIINRNLLAQPTRKLEDCYRIYANNLQYLKFTRKFDEQSLQGDYERSVFKNSLFDESIYTLKQGSTLNLNLKGQLLGLIIKSDWYDGFFQVKFGEQSIVTSSFSEWVQSPESANLNLITLPYQKFSFSKEPQPLSISVCPNPPDKFELDWHKMLPQVSSSEWKLNIAGIAYLGEII
ncbi:hypothetical protein STA3757_38830 [Stanieria sp. NIES-3757]|nr:hypothetical protein STA3757_38830 [Stanieria sp. NIES-3757]